MRVWCRAMEDGDYASINVAAAAAGFKASGAAVERYNKLDDVFGWVTESDIVVDGVRQTERVFQKFGIVRNVSDYPEVLLPFTGRRIWTDTVGHLRKGCSEALFVKPTKEKLFAGRVITSAQDWAAHVSISSGQEVFCSDVIDIRSEYRVFIRYDSVLDVRPYYGDYHYSVNTSLIDTAIDAFTRWEDRPAACALDFAVTNRRKTVFLELNDAYSIGAYGLDPILFERFLATRWTQLMDVPDPYIS